MQWGVEVDHRRPGGLGCSTCDGDKTVDATGSLILRIVVDPAVATWTLDVGLQSYGNIQALGDGGTLPVCTTTGSAGQLSVSTPATVTPSLGSRNGNLSASVSSGNCTSSWKNESVMLTLSGTESGTFDVEIQQDISLVSAQQTNGIAIRNGSDSGWRAGRDPGNGVTSFDAAEYPGLVNCTNNRDGDGACGNEQDDGGIWISDRVNGTFALRLTAFTDALKDNGETCSDGSECESEDCVDGVCCSASSCDSCLSCNVLGLEGDCVADLSENGSACDDGLFCNGADSCLAGLCASHVGDPCATGGECSNACNEDAGNCLDLVGAACTTDSNDCTDDVCDGAGACQHPNKSAGESCGSATDSSCTDPDTCDGSGTCLANHEAQGTPCGDVQSCTALTRTNEDTCNDSGSCVDNGLFSCAPFTCNDAGLDCLDGCFDDEDCSLGATC